MHKIIVIAHNTFKETIRERILYNILIFAVILIAFSYLLRTLTILQDAKIVVDLSLGCISIFGVLIAIFIGIGLVYKEVEKRTIYTILSKPVSRTDFIVGKYLGLLITLLVNVAIMTVVMYVTLAFTDVGIDPVLLKAVYLTYLELAVITAIAVFFSSFTTPVLSAIFTLSFFVIGHMTTDLKLFGQQSGITAFAYLTKLIYWIFPNLSYFNKSEEVVYKIPIAGKEILGISAYGAGVILIFLFLSFIIFSKRDFK